MTKLDHDTNGAPDVTARLKRALVALEKMGQRLDAVEREPIAVIGIGCRFPGGVEDADSFWALLRDGRDPITAVPSDRWDVDAFYDPDPNAVGKMYTRRGGFLDQVRDFDAEFFGISPREAVSMDPQQRLLLEVSWEALEDAGQRPDELGGSKTGVFFGFFSFDYYNRQVKAGAEKLIDAYTGTGNTASVAAGRVSYVLGLQGPSIAVDSACSSSLVAVHLACQSLRSRESDLALVGGVNLILTPDRTVYFCKLKAMAADGRCKAFDAAADGYVRGEGCGVAVLKRYSDALRDGDRILALVRGSACNQDGRSNGLTAPNGPAQEAVIRRALANARLSPADVTYVEAHGSGTPLGDPIELHALGSAYGDGRPVERTLLVGSVKTNFGHTEAAAGIAGFIKAVLALHHDAIPPHLHLANPSPNIRWNELPIAVPTQLTSWPAGAPRRAGVNSFGFSGTNAHVIVEAPPRADRADRPAAERPWLVPLSAQDSRALEALARRWRAFVPVLSDEAWPDVVHTAARRRAHLDERLALVARSPAELAERLDDYLSNGSGAGVAVGTRVPGLRRKVVFVFPGQGSQWRGMGRALLESEPAFADTIARCERAFAPYVDWSLRAELTSSAANAFERIDALQPLLLAVELAIAETWRAYGVEPDVVIGHSMGEVAAACFAGALTLDDAARIICQRSRLLAGISGRGAMLAVELSLDDARSAIRNQEGRVSVAACNGPRAIVLSGEQSALSEVVEQLERSGVFYRWVKVDVASHSPQVDPLRGALLDALAATAPRASTIRFHSTVDEGPLSGSELDARYWVRNLREPVLFWPAVERLLAADHEVFVEISPHPILLPALRDGIQAAGRGGHALPSLRRDEDERATMLESVGALFTLGHPLEWPKLAPAGAPVSLPRYPWTRERYWLELSAEAPAAPAREYGRELIPGRALETPLRDRIFETFVSSTRAPFLDDHQLHGNVVVPGAFHAAAVLAAAEQALAAEHWQLVDAFFPEPCVLAAGEERRAHVVLESADAAGAKARVYSAPADGATGEGWRQHFDGRLSRADLAPRSASAALAAVRQRCVEEQSGEAFYEAMRRRGYLFGDSFRTVASLRRRDGEVLCEVRRPPAASASQARVSLLDILLQLPAAAFPSGRFATTLVPVAFERLRWSEPLPDGTLFAHAELRADSDESVPLVDVRLLDSDGRVLAELSGLRAQAAGEERFSARAPSRDSLFEVEWRRVELAAASSTSVEPGGWLVFGGDDALTAEVAEQARAAGEVAMVRAGRSFERTSSGWQLDPDVPQAFEQLLSQRAESSDVPLRGVLFLWDLAGGVAGRELSDGAAFALLSLVQALARHRADASVRLVIVTRAAHGMADEPVRPAGALSWGIAATLALEHPEFRVALLDLPALPMTGEARQVWDVVTRGSAEPRLLLRADGLRGERVVPLRAELSAAAAAPIRADASYLITGGCGAIGLLLARELVARGARHLTLIGRSGLNDDAARVVSELQDSGADVRVRRADVTQRAEIEALFEEQAATAPPVRGIFHAAAVLDDGILLEQSRERFQRVLAPKVEGVCNLELASRGLELDFFVLFSSTAAWLGAQAQAAYAAANRFLDAFAQQRRARGLPALSISWGPWAEVGLAAAQSNRGERLTRLGMKSLRPEQGIRVLFELLAIRAGQVGVMELDASRWLAAQGSATRALLSELVAHTQDSREGSPREAGSWRASLLALPAGPTRLEALESGLRELVARVLRLSSARLDVRKPLGSLGLDSLMALELRNRLESGLGLTLPATVVWTHPTVAQLATHLANELGLLQVSERAELASVSPAPAELELGALSEADLALLLADELKQLEDRRRV